MKRKIIVMGAILIMCFAFVGCGGEVDLNIKINEPIVSSEGVETTFTSLTSDAVMTPNFDVINTFELEVKAVNKTGTEDELWNVENSMELFGPNGTEVDTSISGPGYVMTGYITQNDKQYVEGKVLDGGSKEYTIAFPDPGEDGEYILTYGEYKLYFTVEHLDKEEGGTTITYPTAEGEQVYQSWPTE